MSTTTEELQVVLTGDVADFAASMKAATGALNTIAAGMQRTEKEVKKTQSAVEKFTAVMTRAGERAEFVGKQFKKLGSVGTEIGGALAAAFAGAFLGGAKYDAGIAKQLKELQDIAGSLAVEVASALMPAAREFAGWLKEILGWVQGLNPELKEQIAHYAVMALKIAAVVAVMGRIGGVVDDVAEFFTKMLVPLLPILGTLIAITAVVGTLALAYGFVKEAMDGAFGPAMKARVEAMGELVSAFARVWSGIVTGDWEEVKNSGFHEAANNAKAAFAKDDGPLFGGVEIGEAFKMAGSRVANELIEAGKGFGQKAFDAMGLGGLLKGGGPGNVRSTLKEQEASAGGAYDFDFAANMIGDTIKEMDKDIAEQTDRAVKAFRESQDAKVAALNRQVKRDMQLEAEEAAARADAVAAMEEGAATFASRFLAAAGRAGTIASNAMQSAKQLGPVGAIISVILDIFMDMKAGALAINNATKGLRMITRLLDEIFGEMSIVMEVLLRGSVIPLILAFKTMGVPTLGLAIAIGEAMNWFYQLGANIGALLTGQEMRWVEFVDLTGLKEKFAQIRDMDPLATYERLSALDDAANSADNFSHTLDSISESMTNIPATFKLAAHRFAAQDATGGGGGFRSASPVLNARTGARGEIINININGNVVGGLPQDIVDQIERAIGRRNFTRTGHPAANT